MAENFRHRMLVMHQWIVKMLSVCGLWRFHFHFRQEESFLRLNEGDFFITKHSNLSEAHVVFHLVADESSLQTKVSLSNVTSRHPVVISLRQILKVGDFKLFLVEDLLIIIAWVSLVLRLVRNC